MAELAEMTERTGDSRHLYEATQLDEVECRIEPYLDAKRRGDTLIPYGKFLPLDKSRPKSAQSGESHRAKSVKFREHRGSYDESIATAIEVADRAALIAHIQGVLARYDLIVRDEDVRVEHYWRGYRQGSEWNDTHIVTVAGYGVFGFTNAPA